MPNLVRLASGLLKVGKPTPWPVYDEHGGLLVAQGYVLQSETQLERLEESGFYERPEDQAEKRRKERAQDRSVSPFAEYAPLLYELEEALSKVVNAESDASSRIAHLARRIARLCRSDTDACIALIHVYSVEPNAYEQTLFYAILSWLAAEGFDLGEQRTNAILMAALTANTPLLPFLDKLNQSNKGLTDEQRSVIQKHPILSAEALRQAGVEDEVCLKIVEQHHESYDGSGYPNGLRDGDILVEAKVLALAERYTAMISKRAYRNRHIPSDAMAEILKGMDDDPHRIVYDVVFKALTPYPPGALVRLINGEHAIVTHRRRNPEHPLVRAIFNAQGKRYLGPLKRDTSDEDFHVERTLAPNLMPSLNLAQMWGYG